MQTFESRIELLVQECEAAAALKDGIIKLLQGILRMEKTDPTSREVVLSSIELIINQTAPINQSASFVERRWLSTNRRRNERLRQNYHARKSLARMGLKPEPRLTRGGANDQGEHTLEAMRLQSQAIVEQAFKEVAKAPPPTEDSPNQTLEGLPPLPEGMRVIRVEDLPVAPGSVIDLDL
jgi:hypothetical protein